MKYTTSQYAKTYHPDKNIRTVNRMIARSLIPENHIKVKHGIIEVVDVDYKCDCFLINLIDYCKVGNFTHETAAKFCVENDFNMHKFCKMIGI